VWNATPSPKKVFVVALYRFYRSMKNGEGKKKRIEDG
jgi:hypothetical protein